VVQTKATETAMLLKKFYLVDPMDPMDGRQYREEYVDKMADILDTYELQPRKLKGLIFAVLDVHLVTPAPLSGVLRVPSAGAAHNFKMLKVCKQIEQIKVAYVKATEAGFPFFSETTDGGKKCRQQRQDVTT